MIAYPFLCKYDVSKSTLWCYDFLSMNPNILWFLMLLAFATALVAWKKSNLGLPSLIAVVLLFSLMEVSANYPLIWRDVYLHGSVVKGILNEGRIAPTWNEYASTHPGFFLLWSTLTVVTGLDPIPSNVLVLLPVAMMLLIALMILIYRRLSAAMGNVAVLLAFLLMNFNANEFTFIHFNTRLLSLLYVLLFLLLFLNQKKGVSREVCLLLTTATLVISHVLNSLVPILFLAIYWLFERKQRKSIIPLTLCCVTIYASWNLYVGYPLLKEGVTSFLNSLYVRLALKTMSEWSPIIVRPQPLFGLLLGGYYKVLLVVLGLVSLYTMTKLRKQRNVRLLAYYLLAAFLVYGLTFFSAVGPSISVDRGIIFASFALASLPIILFTSTKRSGSSSLRRRLAITAIILMIIPQFVLSHELPLARYGSVGSIDLTSHFILGHRANKTIVSLGDFPIYYCFYEPFYGGYENLGFSGWSSLNNITNFLVTSPKDSLKIVDYKKIVDWGFILGHTHSYDEALREWDTEIYAKLNLRFNRIYSNDFETIYR